MKVEGAVGLSKARGFRVVVAHVWRIVPHSSSALHHSAFNTCLTLQ
jgi:uncharacterized LabA/DUF88 family protein